MLAGCQSRFGRSLVPCLEASLSHFRYQETVPSLHWMGTGRRRLMACFPNRRYFPCSGRPTLQGAPPAQALPWSLHRWGQHRAPAPAPPAVHHAPGGAGCGRGGRGHQLCLRSPPQLLQLLRQLHEPSGALQPHESCQQRPVPSGRWPRPSAQGPVARPPPAQASRAPGDRGWRSLGKKSLVSTKPLAAGYLERVQIPLLVSVLWSFALGFSSQAADLGDSVGDAEEGFS